MTVQDLKNKCNELYESSLSMLEQQGDINTICRNLLDVASLLLEIGKLDLLHYGECQTKANKILECAKKFRVSKDFASAYKSITGRAFPAKEKIATPKQLPSKKDTTTKEPQNSNANRQEKQSEQDDASTFMFKWDEIPIVSFEDVAGLDNVKQAVFQNVILPLQRPDLYDGYIRDNGGGLLLYGPPGTGKTMIAAAIAHEIGAKFCSIGISDLALSGNGASERAIVKLFQEARSFECSVIYFDEADSIFPAVTRSQYARQRRSELLRQMQGLETYIRENDKILYMIAATNKPWEIDSAFVRPGRFGTRIYVDLPDAIARAYIINSRLNKIREANIVQISDEITVDYIVEKTEGFNGSDVTNLLNVAQDKSISRTANGEEKRIILEDFEEALNVVTSSVQSADLVKLEQWKEQFGQN